MTIEEVSDGLKRLLFENHYMQAQGSSINVNGEKSPLPWSPNAVIPNLIWSAGPPYFVLFSGPFLPHY